MMLMMMTMLILIMMSMMKMRMMMMIDNDDDGEKRITFSATQAMVHNFSMRQCNDLFAFHEFKLAASALDKVVTETMMMTNALYGGAPRVPGACQVPWGRW